MMSVAADRAGDMTNTSKEAWNTADVHFRHPGQNLGSQRANQIQTRAKVQFEGSWLHLQLSDQDDEIISVPASAVDRVQWSPTR